MASSAATIALSFLMSMLLSGTIMFLLLKGSEKVMQRKAPWRIIIVVVLLFVADIYQLEFLMPKPLAPWVMLTLLVGVVSAGFYYQRDLQRRQITSK